MSRLLLTRCRSASYFTGFKRGTLLVGRSVVACSSFRLWPWDDYFCHQLPRKSPETDVERGVWQDCWATGPQAGVQLGHHRRMPSLSSYFDPPERRWMAVDFRLHLNLTPVPPWRSHNQDSRGHEAEQGHKNDICHWAERYIIHWPIEKHS